MFGEIGILTLDFDQLLLDESIDNLLRLVVVIGQGEKFANLCHAEPEFAGASHEGECRLIVGCFADRQRTPIPP